MPIYAQAIYTKLGVLDHLWGFIDGTIRRMARHTFAQYILYTQYRRCHALKFQSVITPDGYIAHMFGPCIGRRHDNRMMNESGLLHELMALMPLFGNGRVFALFGDLAYAMNPWMLKGFVNPAPGSPQANFNTMMSSLRIAVEWGFHNLLAQFTFLDFRRSMQVYKMPVGRYFVVAAFLSNIRVCYYGSQTSEYFGCAPLQLQQYLALVD